MTDELHPRWDYTVGPWEDLEELDSANSECETQHLAATGVVWARQHEVSLGEARRRESATVECLAGAGFEVAGLDAFLADVWPTLSGGEEISAAVTCIHGGLRSP